MKKRFAIGLSVLLALLALAPAGWAQGCALCKQLAESTGPDGAKALNLGIFILLIPTVLIFIGIFVWAFFFRDRSWAGEKLWDVNWRSALPSWTRLVRLLKNSSALMSLQRSR